MDITRETILAERLNRQGFVSPAASEEAYLALFRSLQPVAPKYFSCPGNPPTLAHRVTFNDAELTGRWRERREVVKGRFLNGIIGYVHEDDFALYANAFRHQLAKMTWVQRWVFEALETTGPLTPRQISEETDLLNKEIMPALHRLQEAFLVYEDQLTCDNERGWYVFASEWPEIVISDDRREAAMAKVLLGFLQSVVFATAQQMKDWSGWTMRDVKMLLAGLAARDAIVPLTVTELGEGWICARDADLQADPIPPSVFMLHKADPLVRMHASELKTRYQGKEVLQYLLIDGAMQGAVLGHWRIGPHDVDDILVELPAPERIARREAILQAVAWGYQPPFSNINRFAGGAIE